MHPTLRGRLLGDVMAPWRNAFYLATCNYYERKNKLLGDGTGYWNDVLRVDPDDIRYVTRDCGSTDYGHPYLDAGAFHIVTRSAGSADGEWDRTEIEFSEFRVYQAIRDRFERDIDWEETEFFRLLVDLVEAGKSPKGCTTRADALEYCAYIDDLYERIREHGYRSQRELGKVAVDEVTVNVGRDGTLLFNDGRHRLSIAKTLGVDEIPVRVLVTHQEFDATPDLASSVTQAPSSHLPRPEDD